MSTAVERLVAELRAWQPRPLYAVRGTGGRGDRVQVGDRVFADATIRKAAKQGAVVIGHDNNRLRIVRLPDMATRSR